MTCRFSGIIPTCLPDLWIISIRDENVSKYHEFVDTFYEYVHVMDTSLTRAKGTRITANLKELGYGG